jgi:hypothetical protein
MALLGSTAAGGVRLDGAAIARFLRSEQGPIGRDLAVRATRVQEAAKAQCGYSEVPSEDSHLRDTIVKRWAEDSQGPMVLVGSSHDRALMHHEGTAPHEILPQEASVLAFPVEGAMVFTMHVDHPGTAPNRFLTDNLDKAR